MTDATMDHRIEVARQLIAVGKSLRAFEYGEDVPFEGRRQYLSRSVDQAMKEAEAAFSVDDYDRAGHLVKVVAAMVRRETPIFAANPSRWIERWHEAHQ